VGGAPAGWPISDKDMVAKNKSTHEYERDGDWNNIEGMLRNRRHPSSPPHYHLPCSVLPLRTELGSFSLCNPPHPRTRYGAAQNDENCDAVSGARPSGGVSTLSPLPSFHMSIVLSCHGVVTNGRLLETDGTELGIVGWEDRALYSSSQSAPSEVVPPSSIPDGFAFRAPTLSLWTSSSLHFLACRSPCLPVEYCLGL